MCGIAGYYGAAPLPDENLARCRELMHHRGPDGHGAYSHVHPSGRCVHLLHSRLAILDLSPKGAQPMRHGDSILCYNGELYNYLELKSGLEDRGKRLDTTSDTEVLLRLLAEAPDPARALNRCEGMWALALYDEKEGSLLLSRDRFGEKPLLVWDTPEGVYFGSEMKFLAALRGTWPAPDREQCLRFLAHGYKALYKVENTWFRGVRDLPAATFRILDGTGSRERRYWRLATETDVSLDFEEAVRRARESLIRSVELRLRADVPLAFCLSGGVDSNALASLAAIKLGYDVHGFTVMDDDGRYDESEQVLASVASLGIRHTPVRVRRDGFLDNLRELVRAHDGPVATISYYAHWLLMQAVAENGYKISISGTAADELFTGYYDHHLLYLASVAGDAKLHARSLAAWQKTMLPMVRNPLLRDPDAYVRDPGRRGHIFDGADKNKARLRVPFTEPFTELRYSDSLLRNRMCNELFQEVIPVILREDDLNAMYWSVENRSPFLDRNLVETCAAIPDALLMRNGYAKAVLREAVRGIAPDNIVNEHRKVGFNAAITSFLDFSDSEVRDAVLADSPVFDMVRRESVEEILGRDTVANDDAKFLFAVLNVKFFLEQFQGGRSAFSIEDNPQRAN
ncbi:Asparagine synthetase [glutamine-hydrolyzing] 1 [Pseudodesulfovibrio hydrargyri]|uniref:asparagine synthase (glutamine-hydrolyzing) n=1 Tax=Pseudodesulfovibrio hydrargyri TaxID=2125990 RepID=A0A1J5MTU5_9BACT|nr:asparagine synthase (glutamine-hydrolyzing) [Pseudodesulfovibrio hydrargyri]OIQ50053.1 Asparagine synthetase [glutamine-hydrolyzing] 1 [Pseudodesulfovibrio hydrargyri]